MRGARKGWLLVGAILFALVALATPIVLKGLPQWRFQRAMENVRGAVQYDFQSHGGEERRQWWAGWVGPALVGTIRHVDFINVPAAVGSDPAAMFEWLERCRGFETIDSIFIRGEGLDQACFEKIGQINSLDSIIIDFRIDHGKGEDLAPLARLPQLRFVHLPFAKGVTPETIDVLAKFPALVYLSLANTDLKGSSLARFRNFPHLLTLELYATDITTDDLLLLGDAPALNLVRVSRDISGGSEGLQRVREALPQIEFTEN